MSITKSFFITIGIIAFTLWAFEYYGLIILLLLVLQQVAFPRNSIITDIVNYINIKTTRTRKKYFDISPR